MYLVDLQALDKSKEFPEKAEEEQRKLFENTILLSHSRVLSIRAKYDS